MGEFRNVSVWTGAGRLPTKCLACLLTQKLSGPEASLCDSGSLSCPVMVPLSHSQGFTARAGDGLDSLLGPGDRVMNAHCLQSTVEGQGTHHCVENLSDERLHSITHVGFGQIWV